jgi:hypothetical protein
MFVCNKSSYAGWGFWLRDAGRGLQKDRVIWTSGDRVIGKTEQLYANRGIIGEVRARWDEYWRG